MKLTYKQRYALEWLCEKSEPAMLHMFSPSRQIMQLLERKGLVKRHRTDTWSITEAGRSALKDKS